MRWGVVTFPGSNDDRDVVHVLADILGQDVCRLWHKDADLHGVECVVLPGGFSYGDYLRCGAMAKFSPIMRSIRDFSAAGGFVIGICNGFQILCEAELLPGALIRNRSLLFVCASTHVRVETMTPFTHTCAPGEVLSIPVKHGAGCYGADVETLRMLEREERIVLRYVDARGRVCAEGNPNGSVANVAGVTNAGRNVLGLMPHPEHAAEKLLGGDDGLKLFSSLITHRAGAGGEERLSLAPGP